MKKKNLTACFLHFDFHHITSDYDSLKATPTQSANSFTATLIYLVQRQRRVAFPNDMKSFSTEIHLKKDRTW